MFPRALHEIDGLATRTIGQLFPSRLARESGLAMQDKPPATGRATRMATLASRCKTPPGLRTLLGAQDFTDELGSREFHADHSIDSRLPIDEMHRATVGIHHVPLQVVIMSIVWRLRL